MEDVELNSIHSKVEISVDEREVEQLVKQITRKILTDYCKNTTIPGCKYLTERQRHWTERFLWVIVFIVLTCSCGIYVAKTWLEWNDNPGMMSMSEEEISISEIPFPTVTICPEAKAARSKLQGSFSWDPGFYGVVDGINVGNVSKTKSSRYVAVQHLCSKTLPRQFKDQNADENIFSVLKNMAPNVVKSVQWNLGWERLDAMSMGSAEILTEEGLCSTFNTLRPRDIYTNKMAPGIMMGYNEPRISHWSPDNGYDNVPNGRKYPIQTYFTGDLNGALRLELINEDRGYSCIDYLASGYKVFLHAPGETIRFSSLSFHVPSSQEVSISIKAKLTNTSEGLRNYTPAQRRCFYNSERKLTFFKIYSQKNCLSECVASYVLEKCGCVKFSMPRYNSTKICGTANIPCYVRYEIVFYRKIVTSADAVLHRESCNCLPACYSVSYYADIYRMNVNIPKPQWFGNMLIDGFQNHSALMTIFFRDDNIEKIIRKERGTFFKFLSDCAGFIGLFLGVSALSIVEIIYYTTTRLLRFCRQWRYNRAENNPVATIPQETAIDIISIEIPNSE